jgi:hypothetical protein
MQRELLPEAVSGNAPGMGRARLFCGHQYRW